jgi:hypothetical protein
VKRVAIVQSNYIPWKGYFDLIASVDEFIICDAVQYTHRDWRNRNRIKTPQGMRWLTVPVLTKGRALQLIRETQTDGSHWAAVHWRTIASNYARTPHFEQIAASLEPIYKNPPPSLSGLNEKLIKTVCVMLGISTRITTDRSYRMVGGKSLRAADLCEQAGATTYVSGPAAKAYLDESILCARGIQTIWFDYSGYPEYPQLWGDFVHEVSILDLLFNCGPDAPRYMKHVS